MARAWLADALSVKEPFPWQLALLDQLLGGGWPSSLDLPTGLGKTSVLAIWVVARACGAKLPRRLIYVVDRRAVIDQATEVAENLQAKVREWTRVAPEIAERLGLGPEGPLPVSTLRGQLADNKEWLTNPAASAIVLGTIDMIGSRLLFEGYGVSRRMRPYHAGLLGADALVILDEAHLVPAFEALVRSASDDDSSANPLKASDETRRQTIPALSIMSLSATGRSDGDRTFRLTKDDEAHPIVRQRLHAKKCILLCAPLDPADSALSKALATEAWALSDGGQQAVRCIVFCNSREDAQRTQAEIFRLGRESKSNASVIEPDVELFVGGRRVFERAEAAKWLRDRGFLAGHAAKPSAPTFVIATSAGEVGVDLDADHMVSDVVAWERMVQRLGRVNRRGDGAAKVIVIPVLRDVKTVAAFAKEEEKRGADDHAAIRRAELVEASAHAIRELPAFESGRAGSPQSLVDLKRRAQGDPRLAALLRSATTRDPLRPELTRPLLESWSMTSLEVHAGRPEVQPWIRGWIDDEPQTSIVWRDLLPCDTNGQSLGAKDVDAFFEAAAPHMLEVLETETFRAVEWLLARIAALDGKRAQSVPLAELSDEEEAPGGGDDSGDATETEQRDASESHEGPRSAREKRRLTPDDVVAFVINADGKAAPLIGSLPDDSRDRKRWVDDISALLTGGRLVVDARMGGLESGLLEEDEETAALDVTRVDVAGIPFRVTETTARTSAASAWREELRVAIRVSEEGIADRWIAVERRPLTGYLTEEGRSISRAQLLDAHQDCAEKWARAIALRLGLSDPFVEMLALAARLHDEGKRANRWQRAFSAQSDGIYGKTASRPNIALLDGYRHEFGSLPHAETDPRVGALPPELRDLCLHLIAAHHGHARPTIPTRGCEDAPPSALVERAREVALRFSRLEKAWGPWGLAWWEVLLRAADQQASRENDAREATGG